jgi:chemotaxis protein methyltransferase CheR
LALERGRLGSYALGSREYNERNYLAAGGTASLATYARLEDGSVVFDPVLRKNIVFASHSLVTDGPFNQFHLIVCRNTLPDYNPALQSRVQRLFQASLLQLGYLCLGRGEALSAQLSLQLFQVIDPMEKIYRRVR